MTASIEIPLITRSSIPCACNPIINRLKDITERANTIIKIDSNEVSGNLSWNSNKNLLVAELEKVNIISESNELNLRVPPGIHAELGNLLAFDQQNEAAIAEFNKEMNVYPESKVFIERLLSGITQGGEK